MGQDPSTIRREIEETRAEMGDTVEALGYKADVKSRAKENVQGKVGSVKEKITGAKDSITGSAGSAVGSVSDATPDPEQVKQQAKRAAGVAQENPLGLAVGSLAVGFLAGMLIPETKVEHEKLGPVADQVKDQVREAGQEALEHGKQVAQETAQAATSAAKETAQEAGQQHAQELKESAQESAEDTARYTRQSVS
jgi:gas vesicle protein